MRNFHLTPEMNKIVNARDALLTAKRAAEAKHDEADLRRIDGAIESLTLAWGIQFDRRGEPEGRVNLFRP